MRPDSIRGRLTLWYASILAAVLIVFSLGVYWLMEDALHDRVDEGLQAVIEVATTSLRHDAEEGQSVEDAARSTAVELSARHEHLAIYDAAGRLLARSASAPVLERLPRAAEAGGSDVRVTTVRGHDDGPHRVAVKPVSIPNGSRQYVIAASQSLEAVDEEMESLREILVYGVLIAVALATLGGWFMARQSFRPVLAMAERARRMGAENIAGALPVADSRDELGRLALAFNELLARIHSAFVLQRRFMADASHELRTPVAALQTAAAVALHRPEREEQEYREALTIIDGQARRLNRVVQDMFTLARADAGQYPLQRSRFYLDELVADAGRAAGVLAQARGVTIDARVSGEAPFDGDEELINRLVMNLLDNAVKHAPEGGVIALSLEADAASYRIDVADAGPGIPEEARSRIFERFFRADSARSRAGRAASGAGLGLAIARWVAEAHAGTVTLTSAEPGRTVFTAVLPRPR